VKPGEEDTKAHELVIIRRRSGGEEGGHHGGVWKIAYADFMTAMMAFFLVMWLINSTDQKVLTQVANYFNPMRLTDSTPHSRGVNTIESGEQGKQGKHEAVGDPKEKAESKHKKKDKKAETGAAKGAGDAKGEAEGKGEGVSKGEGKAGEGAEQSDATKVKARFTEQALFSDPYGVLARIAAEAVPQPPTKDAIGAGGELYRDPFDPTVQNVRPNKEPTLPKAKAAPVADPVEPAMAKTPASDPQARDPNDAAPPGSGGEAKTPQENVSPPPDITPADKESDSAVNPEPAKTAKQTAVEKAARIEAAKIESDIQHLATELPGTLPNIDVTTNDDGVLISLTDDYDFGMFAIASAEPRPAMVVVMEKMAKVLQQYRYPLIVRGHTDGRPYRSGNYDNWRLSTARAHMAYYMLVRGGVEEKRFERVEGYADRSLRVPHDPTAAQNRRIEILLRRPRS
jgi:chemotaxis protein MotB